MSYRAEISFARIEPEELHDFFAKFKAETTGRLVEIADREWRRSPFGRSNLPMSTDLGFEDFVEAHEDLCKQMDAWVTELFSFRWFWMKEEKTLGMYGVPEPCVGLFDKTVFFQDSADHDYGREEWEGVPAFEAIFDKWDRADEKEMAEAIARRYGDDVDEEDEADDDWISYNRRSFAYEEIWGKIGHTLFDDAGAVYVQLFSYYDFEAKKIAIERCFENARRGR